MESQNQFKESMLGNALAFAFNAIVSNIISWIAFIFVSIFFMFLGFLGLGLSWGIFRIIFPISNQAIVIIPDRLSTLGFGISHTFAIPQGLGEVSCALLIGLLGIFYFFALWLGFHRAYIRFHDTGEIKYRPVFDVGMVLSSIIAWTLLVPLIIGGMILLLVPGIIVILRSFFTQYFIVDKNMGPIEAIKASWTLTKGKYNQMIGLLLIIILCGLIPIIGVYVVSLITVYAYRNIGKAHSNLV
jgi:uncharacterized membrane protein